MKSISAALVLGMILLTPSVLAVESSPPPLPRKEPQAERSVSVQSPKNESIRSNNQVKEDNQLSQEERRTKIKRLCNKVKTGMQKHQTAFQNKVETRLPKYQAIINRLDNLSQRWQATGVDTTELNSYLAELRKQNQSLGQSVESYKNQMQSNTSAICNLAQPEQEIENRRADLQSIIQADRDLRFYIKQTILPKLKSLKSQVSN